MLTHQWTNPYCTLPAHRNEKGLVGGSVIASVYTDKFQFHQPLHRHSQAIRQQTRVGFAESTLVDMVTTANFWLHPIAARIEELILAQSYIQVDESRIPVLTKGKKGKVLSGYEWVIFCPQMKAAVFRYEPGRAQRFADEWLKTYRGRMQTDDYVGYKNLRLLEVITPIGCNAHARRYFVRAIDHPDLAQQVLDIYKQLYAVEELARSQSLSHEQRGALRNEQSRPIMARLHELLRTHRPSLTPASQIAKACDYVLSNWALLTAYLDDGEIEIDNNLVENQIRPLALGRKNWMFAGSPNGAKRASTAYTLIATAKLHGLDPYQYILMLLTKLPGMQANQIDSLLPWNLNP
jgi:hypothetical protein